MQSLWDDPVILSSDTGTSDLLSNTEKNITNTLNNVDTTWPTHISSENDCLVFYSCIAPPDNCYTSGHGKSCLLHRDNTRDFTDIVLAWCSVGDCWCPLNGSSPFVNTAKTIMYIWINTRVPWFWKNQNGIDSVWGGNWLWLFQTSLLRYIPCGR